MLAYQAPPKLDRLDVMIGYPDAWRDCGGARLSPSDLFGDVTKLLAAAWVFDRDRVRQVRDRRLWEFAIQTVNAYNAGQELKVVLPGPSAHTSRYDGERPAVP